MRSDEDEELREEADAAASLKMASQAAVMISIIDHFDALDGIK